ncbi:MAG: DUF1841 family protein [Methylophilaceae bacterium]|nr:DUF1841 family protein [Methylophilaceae bacterium]
MFNPSRDEVRRFFFETWRKYRAAEPLSGLENPALQVVQMHPEYHVVLDAPERYLEREYFPELGETNPFLHMSLHLAILEQLAIDQPPGIVAAYHSLALRKGEHDAQHAVMECLAETLWRAQRTQVPPDGAAYLECLRRQAGMA